MLIYTGGGIGGSLPMIPSRDLNDDEVKQFGGEAYLLATGLYARPGTQQGKLPPKPKGEIDLSDGASKDEAALAGQPLAARKEKVK